MSLLKKIKKINITPESVVLLKQLMSENPDLKNIISTSKSGDEANKLIYEWVYNWMKDGHEEALKYFENKTRGRQAFESLSWKEIGAIRLLDYVKNAGREFENLNKKIPVSLSDPIRIIWLAYHQGKGGGKPEFFYDMIHLFRQFTGTEKRKKPDRKKVKEWMSRHYSGLDEEIVKLREKNKKRILNTIIKHIDDGSIKSRTYNFPEGISHDEKYEIALGWWNDYQFHLKFAVRSPELLNEILDYSLDTDTMLLLEEAREAGIPTFVNPHYLSLLNVDVPEYEGKVDLAIRDYIFYSKELINEFGHIVAWEKEDKVEPGKPNAGGWLLPNSYNIHRRYPEVAILIPDTVGRACGGLCASCQRMYDFQAGRFNFNLNKLKPKQTWSEKLEWLMEYFEKDSQLRDILITGGDAFMSSDRSMKHLLDTVYEMALRKKKNNEKKRNGNKYAEMVRVRLGTRLPVYIPYRITDSFVSILSDFKKKASKLGVKQFIIQTHFISPMEVTPQTRDAIKKLNSTGWTVTNQMVFTAAASRRGFAAKLRQTLNNIGVIPYYTFSVKGYMENYHNFATNERAIQEQMEEKVFGTVPEAEQENIKNLPEDAANIIPRLKKIMKEHELPFLSTDRNIMNLPGVGKSLTFRTIGITRRGRRILEFDHDSNRNHSPIISEMGKVNIIESKPVKQYIDQMGSLGEDPEEYKDVWGYSIGETEPRASIFEYPEYEYKTTQEVTNLEIHRKKVVSPA
ncbi:MAG: KamA family protein [Bacteroidota bacterium]|nr:KamA family protein [Bacteroidota bacterium]